MIRPHGHRLALVDVNRYAATERLSALEVRTWLGVSPTTLWRWVARGNLSQDLTRPREQRFLAADVQAFLTNWRAA